MTKRPSADKARGRARTFAIVIALVFGGIAATSWWTSRDNLRAGSRETSGGGSRLEVDRVPVTYTAVFRVENRAGAEVTVTTEKVWVRRPFASRIETWRGNERLSLRQSAFGILANQSRGTGAPLNITVPPSLASGDLRVDAVLDEAVRDKSILLRERREVYGRTCQVYRAGGPVFAGDVTPYKPGRGTYTDFCVDRNGLVVEEYWVNEDKLVRRRVATHVAIDPPLDEKLFEIDVPESKEVSRGVVQLIDEDEMPKSEVPIWKLPRTPKGFDHLGRYLVVLSDQALPPNSGIPAGGALSTADVYQRGRDIVVVDQDPSLAQRASLEKRLFRDVKLSNLRNEVLIVDARMSEIRGRTGDGSFVRLFGTLPPKDLIRLARGLRPARS
jgi:hypothetical protein